VLLHAIIKRHIVILAPATERVEEKDRVSVASSDELLTGIFKEEHMTIMERVSDLESIDNIGVLLDDSLLNLGRSQSVLIVTIVEDGSLEEAHGLSGDEEVTLSEDSLGLGMVFRHAAECASADFLLAVVKEDGVVDDSKNIFAANGTALDGNLRGALESSLLLSSD
jgi:hypothetical protein